MGATNLSWVRLPASPLDFPADTWLTPCRQKLSSPLAQPAWRGSSRHLCRGPESSQDLVPSSSHHYSVNLPSLRRLQLTAGASDQPGPWENPKAAYPHPPPEPSFFIHAPIQSGTERDQVLICFAWVPVFALPFVGFELFYPSGLQFPHFGINKYEHYR